MDLIVNLLAGQNKCAVVRWDTDQFHKTKTFDLLIGIVAVTAVGPSQ